MTPLLVMLTLHFIGDFLLQSDWMALNKSKNWDALSQHVLVYALTIRVVRLARLYDRGRHDVPGVHHAHPDRRDYEPHHRASIRRKAESLVLRGHRV
jgi:hypothetical protein